MSGTDIIFINLAIIGIIVALFAIFAGQYVHFIAQKTVNDEVDKAKKELKAILKFADALKFYNQNLNLAIQLSEEAIPYLTGIYLIQAKSNLAYYYANGNYAQSRDRALGLAKETLVQSFLYPDRSNNFKINYAYVFAKYAETVPETNQALDFLDKIRLINSMSHEEIEEIDEYIQETRSKLTEMLS